MPRLGRCDYSSHGAGLTPMLGLSPPMHRRPAQPVQSSIATAFHIRRRGRIRGQLDVKPVGVVKEKLRDAR